MILRFKPIPHAPYSLNILGLRSAELDFLPYLLNMHSHCGDVTDGLHVPDFPEQFLFCENPVGILGKECEQVEFLCGKCGFLPVHPDPSGCFIYLDAPDFHHVVLGNAASYQTVVPFQVGLYLATSSLGLKGLVI